MEYTVGKLSALAGVSTRTLRYYDRIGLLKPSGKNGSGYRIYGAAEAERLQQILFYREMDIPLAEIGKIMSSRDYNNVKALKSHLAALMSRRCRLDVLITNVEKTISSAKGEIVMNDEERFEGFKKQLISGNEEKYGKEARERYGSSAVDRSNEKLMGMSREQHEAYKALEQELNETLKAAVIQGDPASPIAQKACALHKKWLCFFWDQYSGEAHRGIAHMYAEDPRFTAYYETIAKGCAVFLRDAVDIFCGYA